MSTTNVNAALFVEVYSIHDDEESDPDPIFYGTGNNIEELRLCLGNAITNDDVTLTLLFHDDDVNHDVYRVCDAYDVPIAIAIMGNI
jgi:hypothetical protein